MSALYLKLEPVAGRELQEIAEEMLRIAITLQINVEVEANGRKLIATPKDSVQRIMFPPK